MALSEEEVRARLITGYLGAAERDLKTAQLILDSGDRDLSSTAAYHLQQCSEKIAKAIFVARAVTVTREHRLRENLEALSAAIPDEAWIERLRPLVPYDEYATTKRYPSTSGKLATGPEPDQLEGDIDKLRDLLEEARREFGHARERHRDPPKR